MNSNKIFNLIIAALFIFFVAIILFIVFKPKEKYSFALTPKETLEQMKGNKDLISIAQLSKKITSSDSNWVLIDVRNQFEYVKGHLPKAKNIYKADILDSENFDYFKSLQNSNKTTVFYGNSIVEANIPYMILKQTGIDNIKILNGAYSDFINKNPENTTETNESQIDIDKAAYDFSTLIRKENEKESKRKAAEKQKRMALQKKKTYKVKKQIKPKKHKIDIPAPDEEEEEDEGC